MKEVIKYIKTKEGIKLFVLVFLISSFIGALLVSSITASKLYYISIFGYKMTIPVGTSLFAITFLSTDVISEVWGKTHAMLLVFSGFISRIATLIFLMFAVGIDGAGAPIWDNQEAYQLILSGSSRIILAGILTYPVSQTADVLIFHFLKKRHKDKNRLWLRNNLSTLGSQLIDSSVFVFIAFGGILPTDVILNIIIGQIIIKWLIAVIDTPFVYIVRNIATSRKLFDFKG